MLPQQQIGRYRLERELGKGGMGVVYLAHDTVLDRPVAVKGINVSADDPEAVDLLTKRIFKEARTVAALSHPAIISIYDVVMEGSGLFLVMEYVHGETLTEVWEREIGVTDRFSILGAVAEALDYAHSHGVIHRDVKPGNIMVTPEMQPKLADFGIAKILGSDTQTTRGLILGTLEFMAPEQIKGETFDGKVDQFALAVVAYRFLTGHRMFEGSDPVTMSYKICHEQPVLPSVHSPWLRDAADQIFLRALAKNPQERFPTCVEFVDALQNACIHLSTTEKRAGGMRPRRTDSYSATAESERPRRFLKTARLLAGVAALCVAGVIAVFALRSRTHGLLPQFQAFGWSSSAKRTTQPTASPPAASRSGPAGSAKEPAEKASNAPASSAPKPPAQSASSSEAQNGSLALAPASSQDLVVAHAPAKKSTQAMAPAKPKTNATETIHWPTLNEPKGNTTSTATLESKSTYSRKLSAAQLLEQARSLYNAKDYEGALPLFQQAALSGSNEAQAYLGSMYLEGRGTVPDFHEALTRFRAAAESGDARGMIGLGYVFEFGKGVPPDYGRAMQYYRQAADAHSGPAMLDVGRLYEYGKGVPRNYEAALEWYRKAAGAGVSEAMNNVGTFYENGRGVPKDKSEALRWYRSAADAGSAHGQANLRRLTATN